MGRKYQSILETVGNTPVVRINRLAPKGVNLYVKVEAFNPLGSVKDRLALGVIEAAEKSGELKPGQTVIEATSGNTGIGLAMVCAAKGYPLVVTMAETFSVERRKLMRFLGAKVILTPAAERAVGMINKTDRTRQDARLVHDPPVRERGQPRHPFAHHRARDPRRLRRRAARLLGHRLRHRRHAEGRRARARARSSPETKIVVCEPTDAPLLGSGIEQARNADGTPAAPHPAFKPHPMQGWTPDFIPKITGDAVAMKLIDRLLADPRPRGDALQPGAGDEGRHLRRHHLGRDLRRRAQDRGRSAERAPTSSACCPTPASAI